MQVQDTCLAIHLIVKSILFISIDNKVVIIIKPSPLVLEALHENSEDGS
jgi:hypothetical protein